MALINVATEESLWSEAPTFDYEFQQKNDLADELETKEVHVGIHRTNIARWESNKETQEDLKSIFGQLESLDGLETLKESVSDMRHAMYHLKEVLNMDMPRYIEREQRFMDETQRAIDVLKLKIASQPNTGPKGFNIADLEDRYKGIADNFYIDGDTLRFYFHSGLQMRVPERSDTLINHGEEFFIELGQIGVGLDLDQLRVRITGEDEHKHYGGTYSPHPHVLSGDEPCLGDFGDVMSQALEAGDIYALIDLTKMFLENCNPEDSAGATYFTPIFDHLGIGYANDNDNEETPYIDSNYLTDNTERTFYYGPWGSATEKTTRFIDQIHWPSGKIDYDEESSFNSGTLLHCDVEQPWVTQNENIRVEAIPERFGVVRPHDHRVFQKVWSTITHDGEVVAKHVPSVRTLHIERSDKKWFRVYHTEEKSFERATFDCPSYIMRKLMDEQLPSDMLYVEIQRAGTTNRIHYTYADDGFIYTDEYPNHVFAAPEDILLEASKEAA